MIRTTLNRRKLLALLTAAPLLKAKSHIVKNRVSVVTDEVAGSQSDALAFAKRFVLQWIELRRVPGTQKQFASLTPPELKRYVAELGESKIKVSVLHAASATPETLEIARTVGASKLLVPEGIILVSPAAGTSLTPAGVDWNPARTPEQPPKGRVLNVRIEALAEMNWRHVLEALERDNYPAQICLETTPDKADDAMRELMHFIGEL